MFDERRLPRLALLALGWWCSAWLGSARAQAPAAAEPTAVRLVVADCLGTSGAEVHKLAALELAPRMRIVDREERAQLTGAVQCEGARALLSVDDASGAAPLRVELDLEAAAPEARQRLLALALAELVTTRQLERSAARASAKPEEPAADAPPPSEEVEAAEHPLRLWVAPSLSLAGQPAAPLVGGGLGASYAWGFVLLVLDADAHFGHSDRASSEVALRVLSACVGLTPVLWSDGALLSAGVGLRMGHVALSATAGRQGVEGDELSGVWLGPAALAALELPLAGWSALRIALEAGHVARPVVGLDERAGERMALRGIWLTASAGFAFPMP